MSDINILNQIESITEKYNLEAVGLFGSRARGDYREDSDYDIFIIGEISLDNELLLESELEAKLGEVVDLVRLTNDLDKNLAKNILNDSKLIYNKNYSFQKFYKFIDNFFIENSDFIKRREWDLLN